MLSPRSSRTGLYRNLSIGAAAALWFTVIGVGVSISAAYENTPGRRGAWVPQWPAASAIRPAGAGTTLVMVAHPRCPCTGASVSELAEMMNRFASRPAAYVLFYRPQGSNEEWSATDLVRSAAAIPGVQVMSDEGGLEARRFQLETSGHTVLYSPDGELLFSGGITAARGSRGENAGRLAIESLLRGGGARRSATPVFGCSLVTP